ncbi:MULTISPECIES: adenine phosphoribosyltransferase [Novosphingobium]|uniref:Adenine phosphoribosyltransferase n=1 Tax=Novosphingobium mathurense TaxID=428990 RepID=A0A1U6HE37_9SPHN|nr:MULTISPECIES: adenine phosphoribosyltransferase [Novosphingobium]CDO36796.1 adenine phosphoribosyltransferase [Novosphingobium sp. KN65.2]SLJ94047.1 adenine phosphoribosyltransferase [Novosphingobium mathurense]
MSPEDLKALVRSIPDFPKPGILFRDVTTLISDGPGFAAAVAMLSQRVEAAGAEAIAGIEARGFIFGAAVAAHCGVGFIPVRKPGKLPVPVLAIDYALEYGTDTLEIDPGAIAQGSRIVLMDDLIATGGTAMAALELIRRAGGVVEEALFLVDLPELGGTSRLREAGVSVEALLDFPGH